MYGFRRQGRGLQMYSEAMIKVSSLSKRFLMYEKPEHRLWQIFWGARKSWFKEFWALRDVCFDIRKGETLAVIGRNGSGKSTLLQMICGTLVPTDGHVEVNGKVAALLELGAGFNSEFTGKENIYLNGAVLGLEKNEIDARFKSIVDFADIGDFINQPVKTYSSGMYVRLAFAVAIHCDPEILIVDEALAVGDFLFQQKCSRFMKEQFSGVTKILVTHDMAAVANLADRVIVLDQGKLVYDGDPQSAIHKYQIIARGGNNQTHIELARNDNESAVTSKASSKTGDERDWIAISDNALSGSLRAKIRKYAYEVDGVATTGAIKNHQKLRIDFEALFETNLDQLIVGYQVQDRFGSVIFGENTLTSEMLVPFIEAGVWRFSLYLDWPVLASGKYSITLGIGSGIDAIDHTIECWAHNVLVLDSSSSEQSHGLFNLKISDFIYEEAKNA